MSPTTKPSTRPLSEAARHIVKPSGIVSTGWPAVEFWLRKMGHGFDQWQQGAAQLTLAKRSDGLYAATVGGVFMSLPRQVGKTYMIAGLVFALCLLHPRLTVLWTAQLLKTSGETFRTFRALAKRKSIAPYVEAVRTGSGDWVIQFTNGSRILLGAREGEFGRGFAEVDVIVFDEAQILDDKTLDAMIPATNASRATSGALVIYVGTPPKPTDRSEVFARAREVALSGDSDDLLYIECSADPSVDPHKWPAGHVDFDAIASANPSYPLRTPRSSILRMAKQLSRESLRREGLGIWDQAVTARAEVSASDWAALVVDTAPAGTPAFGVKFSNDGRRAALAAAVLVDGIVTVEMLKIATAIEFEQLTEWLAERAKTMVGVAVDGRSDAAAFVANLQRRRCRKSVAVTTAQAIEANAGALNLIRSQQLRHTGQPDLTTSVTHSMKRRIGTSGGWGWSPIGEADTLPLEAISLAAWVATNGGTRARRRPNSTGKAVFV